VYEELGGSPETVADVTTLADMIVALGAVLKNAVKAELPAVTSTDNGKVLTVVSGKWAAKTPE
jgi:hypothetical protein